MTLGSPMRTRDGVAEFLKMLDEECPEKSASSDVTDTTAANLSDRISSELSELRTQQPRVIPFYDITKGVCFFQFTPSMEKNSNDIIYGLLKRLTAEQEQQQNDVKPPQPEGNEEQPISKPRKHRLSCRFMNRLIPIDVTCAPHPANVYRVAQALATCYFPESAVAANPELFASDLIKPSKEGTTSTDDASSTNGDVTSDADKKNTNTAAPGGQDDAASTPTDVQQEPNISGSGDGPSLINFTPSFTVPAGSTWSIVMQRRGGMTTIDRDSLITKLGGYIGPAYKVNLTSPDYTFIVEVLPAFCGLSVVRNYSKLLQYNVHRVCHPTLYERSNPASSV